MLDGKPVAQWRGGEHEAAYVRGAQPGEVVAPLHDGEHRAAAGVVERQAELRRQRVAHVRRALCSLVPMNPLGQHEGELGRVAENPHGVEEGVGGAVVLHRTGDCRAGALPLAVGVVEQLFPPIVLDVEVDVGGLGLAVHPYLGEEALEEKPVADRIDGGDAEAVGDRGIGGAAAALAENAQLAGLAHRVPHHEEESREPEPADDTQLVVELAPLRLAQQPPTLARAFLDAEAEEGVVGVSVGHGEAGKRRTHPRDVESAALGDRGGGLESFWARGPAARHLLGPEETPAAVGQEHTLARRFFEGEIGPERREHVVHQPALAIDVAGILGDDPGNAKRLRQVYQQVGELGLVRASLVALDLDDQAIAERLPPFGEAAERLGAPAAPDEGRDLAGRGAGQRDQPLAPLGYLRPRDTSPAARGVRIVAGPGREVSHAGAGDEAGEVVVAALVHRQERRGMGGGTDARVLRRGRRLGLHQELGADDGPDALAPGLEHEPNCPTQIRSICETQASVSQGGGSTDQRFRGDGAVAEGEGGVRAEFGERSH